jgi:hypothetical protein
MASILWRGSLLPGYEACRVFSQDTHWQIEGTAVFAHEQQPCRLNYQIVCDADWKTLSAQVDGWVGNSIVNIQVKTIRTSLIEHWWLNDVEQPDVQGCTDIDLNFSPSTNLIPIRRLNLAVGESAEVKAAWLRFPSFKLEPLPQRYYHLEANTYRYESGNGQFVAELNVNPAGLVLDYPGIWQAEVSSG